MRTIPRYPGGPGFSAAAAAFLALWLGACAPSAPPEAGIAGGPDRALPAETGSVGRPVRFQFIYVIHGEGSYGFFDSSGGRRLADSEALARADGVAREAADAEVFLFHQKPVKVFGLLRIADGTMRHYRNGRLLRTGNYRRRSGAENIEAEADLFRKFAAGTGRAPAGARPFAARAFLYFGHGIPEGALPSFTAGLGRFAAPQASGDKPFSLVVLSACNGGSPAAIRALAPHAYRILASPGELHLSYLDAGALSRLSRESHPPAGASDPQGNAPLAERWGLTLAEESFARLRQKTATAITVALYDADKAAAYLDTRRAAWDQASPEASASGNPAYVYRDCAENPAFGVGGPESGVTVFFRPARFGLKKDRAVHSGWECRVAAPQRLGSLGRSREE